MICSIVLPLASNPIIDAYRHSDLFGKAVFIGLFTLSIVSWVVLLQKWWMTRAARRNARGLREKIARQPELLLHPQGFHELDAVASSYNPFYHLYKVLRHHTLEILQKNKMFGGEEKETVMLSPTDVDLVDSHLGAAITTQTKLLEKNLFLLSTVVTLAPFLGLLGTVWGILITFSELQTHTATSGNQTVLTGLAMALATTVLGLVVAIPALVGHSYLKNAVRDFQIEMEDFSNLMVSSVEMQYRKVDVNL